MIFVFIRRLQVRLEARILVPERIHVDHEVLHGLEVRHRIDGHAVVRTQHVLHRRFARQARRAVDVHRTRTADGGAARAAERDRSVLLGFDVLERVEHGHVRRDVAFDAVAMRQIVDVRIVAEDVENEAHDLVRPHFGLEFGDDAVA